MTPSRPEPPDPLPPLTPHLYAPSAERPLRAKRRRLSATQSVVPHRHGWAQLAFCADGVTRLTAEDGTYLVPPSRALWIPPGTEHAVTVLETTTMVTLYLHQPAGLCGPWLPGEPPPPPDQGQPWQRCRVLEVSDLLRAAVLQLDERPDEPHLPEPPPTRREALLAALICDELRRAPPVRLGIPLPRDKRLRGLCQAVIEQPARHATLEQWAQDVGASPRTLARLFRDELATSFGRWREQVLLAQALAWSARGRPVAWIAGELGYASPSAFSAMVRRTVGQPPSRLFAHASAQNPAGRALPPSRSTVQAM
ncbi:MAG: helix-turn-helix transcriptional regulator [Burkholderiaceae bacterium]|nr:helix-turn-helix transcriptional regulator [Burkholderiaceae bacterium]